MFDPQLTFSHKSSFFCLKSAAPAKRTYSNNVSKPTSWYIDLLNPDTARRYLLNPSLLVNELDAKSPAPKWIIIDEVQKVPALLDFVLTVAGRLNRYRVVTTK